MDLIHVRLSDSFGAKIESVLLSHMDARRALRCTDFVNVIQMGSLDSDSGSDPRQRRDSD